MACKPDIRKNLNSEIRIKVAPLEGANLKVAKQKADDINNQYGYKVVSVFEGVNDYTNKVVVNIPNEMINEYHEYFTKLEEEEARVAQKEDAERAGEEYSDDYLFQTEETVSSVASPETIKKVKEVLDKMGVRVQSLQDYLKGNPNIDKTGVNAIADLTQRIIAVAEGRENVALTEEMVHIATSIIEQKSPKMITEMISKIGRFSIYSRTLEEYKNNPNYQLPNGKPDIRKIKREAVDKLIAELVIHQNEGTTEFPELRDGANRSTVRTWWQKILDWFKGMYRSTDIEIFEDVAERIMTEGFGTASEVGEGVMFQLSNKQKSFQRKLIDTANTVQKVEDEKPADPELRGHEESNNWYKLIKPDGSWERIKKRVTDRVKAWYKEKFPGKVFSKEEKELNEFKRKLGVKYHKYMEEIHGRFFHTDKNSELYGTRRETPLERSHIVDEVDEGVYLKMERYYIDLVNKHFSGEKNPLVFSEVVIYDGVEKEAGTIDLLIVDEDGKTHLYDWKFMSVKKYANDIPWFKQGAFNIQLGRYKDILIKRYGMKDIGFNRAVPILLDIERHDKDDPSSRYLKGIKVGSVDPKQIEDLKLVPFSEETESTGIKNIDKVIKKMNAIHKQLSKKKVTSDEEGEFKRERLNVVREALRYLQSVNEIAPLIDVISVMRKEGEIIISDWEAKFKGKERSGDFTNDELSDFAEDVIEYMAIANTFKDVDKTIGELIYNPSMDKEATSPEMQQELEKRKEVLSKVRDEAQKITNSYNEIDEISKEFADKFIGERNLVSGLLRPEAVVKNLFTSFTGVSDLPTASTRVLYKLVNDAKSNATRDAITKVDKLLGLRKRLEKRGGSLRKLVQRIYQKDEKGRRVNRLVYKYSKDFYDEFSANAAEDKRSVQWIRDNVDVEAYWEEASKLMNNRIKRLERTYDENIEMRDRLILQEKRKWDITRKDFIGHDNYILRRHPLEKWKSDEYKEIEKDGDLLALYNFIHELNDNASEMGYIDNRVVNTFLPFVRKSFAESISWDFGTSAIKNFGKNLKINPDDVGYGKVNELNQELEYGIPKYYTQDFTKTESGENDYSDVSEDLFKNLLLYINHMENYKYMSDVEGQLMLVKQVEKFKGHIATNRVGNPVIEGGRPKVLEENKENRDIFELFLRGLLYGQKYPLSDKDSPVPIPHVRTFMIRVINKMAGREVIKPDEKVTNASLIKFMDSINRAMQMKTLGFEAISGAANYFGGNIQALAQAGNYFSQNDFLDNERKLFGQKFKSKTEKDIFVKLVDTFMPLRDDPIYERAKKAGMGLVTQETLSDFIMMFMKYPEYFVEKSIFTSLLDNTMVIDGKLVNIREYVRNKYKGRRYKPGGTFKRTERRVKDEIKELKRTKSITATRRLENGELVIPGFDMNNREEIQRLTRLTRKLSRNATGGLSDSDLNMMSMNIWTKSMMIFKSWIPKLVETRFGKFRKITDDFSIVINEDGTTEGEKYDIGRVRLFGLLLGMSVRDRSTHIINMLQANDKGIVALDKMYDDFALKYEQRTGQTFTMTRDDFNDLVRRNLANQMKELGLLMSMFGSMLALGLLGPDEDEGTKADRNFHRFTQKAVDKFVQELSFFYNPVEFQEMISGSAFPAIGLVSDATRFMNHTILQMTGYNLSNPDLTMEEVRERAQPIKHAMKLFPGTKASLTWGAIMSEEWADYFDITIQKYSGR